MRSVKKTVEWLTAILLIGCLGWILFHASVSVPEAKNIFKDINVFPIILTGSGGLLLVFWRLAECSRVWEKSSLRRGMIIILGIIVIVQVGYLYYVRYWVGYDNVLVLDEAWRMQTQGHISPDFYDFYFQRYPHNQPITILLYWILALAGKLGISDLYWIPCMVGLISIDVALVFAWKLTCEAYGIHRGFLLAVLSFFDPVIYIWIPWHYTTICVLPFLSAGIYFGWKTWRAVGFSEKMIYAGLTGSAAALGMRIRITEMILLISFLITGICLKGWKKRWSAGCMTAFLLALGMIWIITGAVGKYYVDFDSYDKKFPPVHFVMMGLGGDGTYKKTDVEFTESFSGEDAKIKEDIREAENRIRNLGVRGMLTLMEKKMLVTWQDGSGGLQSEWLYPLKASRLFQYICGEKNDWFLCWAQIFYVMLMILTIAGTVKNFLPEMTGTGLVLRLILLGNIIFYLLWEAQNHYSLGMMTVFLMLAAEGCDMFCGRCEEGSGVTLQENVFQKNVVWMVTAGCLMVLTAGLLYRPLFTKTTEWREFSARSIYRVGENLKNLKSGDRIVQTFTTALSFNHILVQGYLKNSQEAKGGCQLQIQDETGKILAETFLTAQQIAEKQLDFSFDTIMPEGEKLYKIVIEPREIEKDHALQLYRFNSSMDIYPSGKLSCNGKEENGDLIFSVYEEKTGTIFRRFWE